MADERTSSVPTGDQAIPSAEVSPTAAHQPAAGADARRQKSWVWFAAILAFVMAFGVPYVLLNSGKQREEPERRAEPPSPSPNTSASRLVDQFLVLSAQVEFVDDLADSASRP